MNSQETYNFNNVTFDLKFDSFYNFFESLKESKKYYYDYCKSNNINIKDFDIEYIDNINILKSDLLKYYISLRVNDDSIYSDSERYVIVNDTIKDLYKFMINQFKQNTFEIRYLYASKHIDGISWVDIDNTNSKDSSMNIYYTPQEMYLIESDKNFLENININYLTKDNLSKLIDIYASNANRYEHFRVGFLKKFGINLTLWVKYGVLCKNPTLTNKYNESKNKYLDSLTYESIYERKLNKLLVNLPNICISNISSKKILTYSENNQPNLIDLNDNRQNEFEEVD